MLELDNIVKKYYGSEFYMLACGKQKPVHYVFILESKIFMESKLRKRAEASIIKRLPFELQKSPEILNNLIEKFSILTISEWNTKYPFFPLERA